MRLGAGGLREGHEAFGERTRGRGLNTKDAEEHSGFHHPLSAVTKSLLARPDIMRGRAAAAVHRKACISRTE